jgi:hypothetical protein
MITPPEFVPLFRFMVEPFSQSIARRQVLAPFVDAGFFLGDSTRPEAIDKDPKAVL